MGFFAEHGFLFGNLVIWAILATAFVCYGLLLDLCFFHRPSEHWRIRTDFWKASLQTMLATLPLLGLLGTIAGLLKTFLRMSVEKGLALHELISGGIAEAMFTTQLGLLMVIPGLILLSYLHRKRAKWLATSSYEITN